MPRLWHSTHNMFFSLAWSRGFITNAFSILTILFFSNVHERKERTSWIIHDFKKFVVCEIHDVKIFFLIVHDFKIIL